MKKIGFINYAKFVAIFEKIENKYIATTIFGEKKEVMLRQVEREENTVGDIFEHNGVPFLLVKIDKIKHVMLHKNKKIDFLYKNGSYEECNLSIENPGVIECNLPKTFIGHANFSCRVASKKQNCKMRENVNLDIYNKTNFELDRKAIKRKYNLDDDLIDEIIKHTCSVEVAIQRQELRNKVKPRRNIYYDSTDEIFMKKKKTAKKKKILDTKKMGEADMEQILKNKYDLEDDIAHDVVHLGSSLEHAIRRQKARDKENLRDKIDLLDTKLVLPGSYGTGKRR